MTPKEFHIQFWRKNNPLTTPLWKESEAYAKQVAKEAFLFAAPQPFMTGFEKEEFEEWWKEKQEQ